MRVVVSTLVCANVALSASAQTDWDAVKQSNHPIVVLTEEFDTPYRQPLATGGWEDGIYISRDGLNLYCIYGPFDILSYSLADFPEDWRPYERGPWFGMNMDEGVHADILYARRESTDEPFTEWQLSNLARPLFSEGAPVMIQDTESTAEIFLFTSNDHPPFYQPDIRMIRNTSINPFGIGETLGPLLATDATEDNPHIERLDEQTLVLFYDNHSGAGAGEAEIYFTTSRDDAITWDPPRLLTSVSREGIDELHPHLFFDEDVNEWRLYYVAESGDNRRLGIWRARRGDPMSWDSWVDHELVISPGETAGIGEPTLTREGDLSFVVIHYDPEGSGSDTDKFDADPWFAPRVRAEP